MWNSWEKIESAIPHEKNWKWINNNKKDIFNLKNSKPSLKDTQDMWELNNKHSVKPWCPQQRHHDGYDS